MQQNDLTARLKLEIQFYAFAGLTYAKILSEKLDKNKASDLTGGLEVDYKILLAKSLAQVRKTDESTA